MLRLVSKGINMSFNRVIALAVSSAACLLLAACGVSQQPVSSGTSAQHGATKTSPTPAPAQNVVAIGTPTFAGAAPDPSVNYNGNPSMGVTLTNESKTEAAQSIVMSWTAYNAAGAVIDTEPTTIGVLQPGQTLYVVDMAGNVNTTDIASVKVQALPNVWAKATNPKGVITGQNISITQPDAQYEPNQYQVSAELANGWTSNLESVPSWAYCTDSSGKFVGGGLGFAQLLPASGVGSTSFSVTASAKPANCTIDAQPVLLPQGS